MFSTWQMEIQFAQLGKCFQIKNLCWQLENEFNFIFFFFFFLNYLARAILEKQTYSFNLVPALFAEKCFVLRDILFFAFFYGFISFFFPLNDLHLKVTYKYDLWHKSIGSRCFDIALRKSQKGALEWYSGN